MLWRELDHNPVALLQQISDRQARRARVRARAAQPHQLRLPPHAGVPALDAHLGRAARRRAVGPAVAYFSAEFGLHESLPIYSGGLGILAGDHIKSASDLGIPLVGVGLYYDQGYFRQRLDRDGWQHEDYIDVDQRAAADPAGDGRRRARHDRHRNAHRHDRAPASGSCRSAATRCCCSTRTSRAISPEDRELTARLYGGDERVRIRQELLLGVGGVRALAAMGIAPGVLHLNEGHSAFAALELVRQRMDAKAIDAWRGDAPRGRRRSSSRRTRRFRPATIASRRRWSRSTSGRCAKRWASTHDAFMGLGRVDPDDRQRAVLHDGAGAQDVAPRQRRVVAARPRLARRCGGGSFPAAAKTASRSATSPTASTSRPGSRRRCARCTTVISGPTGRRDAGEPGFWERVDAIDDGELWETHQTLKAQLIEIRAAARGASGRAARRAAGRSSRSCGGR